MEDFCYKNITFEEELILQNMVYDNWIMDCKHLSNNEKIVVERCTRGQNTNPWWEILRKGRITASSGKPETKHIIFNFTYGHIHEKLINENTDLVQSISQHIQTECNSKILTWNKNSGLFISTLGTCCASPDGFITLANNKTIVVEIKNPSSYDKTTWNTIFKQKLSQSKRDQKYYCIYKTAFKIDKQCNHYINNKHKHWRQMQRQMYCSGAHAAIYIVAVNRTKFVKYVLVYKDDDYFQELQKEESSKYKHALQIRKDFLLKHTGKNRPWNMEIVRKNSFADSVVRKNDLALCGFYQINAQVCCFCCNFSVADFDYNTIVLRHKLESPNCDVVQNRLQFTNNEPYIIPAYLAWINQEVRLLTLTPNEIATFGITGCFRLPKKNYITCFACGFQNEENKHENNCQYQRYINYMQLLSLDNS